MLNFRRLRNRVRPNNIKGGNDINKHKNLCRGEHGNVM